MAKVSELFSDLEILLNDMKVEIMIADLLENSSRLDKCDAFIRDMARARTVSFMSDLVGNLDIIYYRLSKSHMLDDSVVDVEN